MILDAVKDLFGLFDHWKWDFLLNLSETDFPVLTLEELEAFLTINRHLNFAKSHGRGNDNFLRKQGLEWTFFECENHMWRLAPRKIPENVRIDGGSDWVVLNRQFLDYVTFSDDSLVAGLKEYFRYSLLPAESFFHSVLINSIHCDSLADANLKLTNWKRSQGCKCQHKQIVDWCGCSPNVLRISDMPKLQFENLRSRLLFFARKFEPIIDQRIIEIVENNLITSYHKLSSSTGTPNSFYNVDKRVSLPGYRNFWLNDFHYLDSSPEISIAKKCLLASLASLTLSQERENQVSAVASVTTIFNRTHSFLFFPLTPLSLQMIDASAVPLELNIYTSPSQTFILLYMTLHYEVPKGTKTLILHAESKFAFVNHFNLSITSQKSVNLMQTRFKSLMVCCFVFV